MPSRPEGRADLAARLSERTMCNPEHYLGFRPAAEAIQCAARAVPEPEISGGGTDAHQRRRFVLRIKEPTAMPDCERPHLAAQERRFDPSQARGRDLVDHLRLFGTQRDLARGDSPQRLDI